MSDWPRIDRDNNFDLIRLFAAFQVALLHATVHLNALLPPMIGRLISPFPGVHIFFFISGLLVTSSVVRRPLGEYAVSRFKRVFPALWLAFVIAIVILAAFGQIGRPELSSPTFWAWVGSQVTVFQIFNPDMFRDFGVGVVNGSLWTIPVEIGFYVILPILFFLAARNKLALTLLMIIGGIVSYGIFAATRDADGSFVRKIVGHSPFAFLWLFALGTLAYAYLDPILRAGRRLQGAPFGWAAPLAVYLAYALLLQPHMPILIGEPIAAVLLSAAVLAIGLIAPSRAHLLRGNDVSYGYYLYHMLAVNVAVALGFSGATAVIVTLSVTLIVACLSWRYLESRVLRRATRAAATANTAQPAW